VNRGRKYKVPSVTKITGIIDKSGPLVGWATNCVLDVVRAGIGPGAEYSETYLEQLFKAAKGRARGVKDEAASIGRQVHEWVEAHIRGEEPVLPPEETQVRSGVDAALKWLGAHQVRFVENERAIYSRQHRYSGRMDGLAYVDDALAVVDWKTSNGIYPEYIIQIAAYALAYTEETGTKISKAFLVRLGKDDGQFEAHEFDARVLKRAGGAFLSALNLWRQLERLKGKI
jgi:hypothetical protein